MKRYACRLELVVSAKMLHSNEVDGDSGCTCANMSFFVLILQCLMRNCSEPFLLWLCVV